MTPSLKFATLLIPVFFLFQSDTPQWKKYTFQEGKFSVILPGEPTKGYRPINKESQIPLTYVYNLQTPSLTYGVTYFDHTEQINDTDAGKKLLNKALETVVKMYSLENQDKTYITFLGYQGYALKANTKNGHTTLLKFYLVKERVYNLFVFLPKNHKDQADALKFFESFKPTPLTDDEIKNLAANYGSEIKEAIPRRMRVSGGVLVDKSIKRVEPIYPDEAKKTRAQGIVRVRVLISEDGDVIEAQAQDGTELLRDAAVTAAKAWKFKPTTIGGYSVQVEGVLTFNFIVK